MKIAIICDVLGIANNGTTLAALNLINHLISSGHDVNVVCPDVDKKGRKGFFVVPCMNLGFVLNKILDANGVKLAKADYKTLYSAIYDRDVVQVEIPFALGTTAVKIANKLNIPVTASFHTQAENFTAHILLMNCKLANFITYKVFYRKLYRHAKMIHYPTNFIRDIFENSIKKKTPSKVISNGVNDFFFHTENIQDDKYKEYGKFLIVCSGRFSKEKQQSILIKAISKCKYKNNIKVVFAGSGPYKNYLTCLSKRLKVNCVFNFFTREELVSLYKSANLYVHTAVIEIEAIACTEAIVSGLVPVICNSNRSATKSFAINEKCLYKMGNKSDLTRKIEYWYENPAEIDKAKTEYKGMIKAFDQEECMKELEEMIVSVGKNEKDN